MKLMRIAIDNYKSLKNIDVTPSNLSVLIGPNASGKSNFIDALHFLGNAYKSGLGNAISMKGGYENIAFRRSRRTKSPISFSIECIFDRQELTYGHTFIKKINSIRLLHCFSFKPKNTRIKSQFEITEERIVIYNYSEIQEAENQEILVSITRSRSNVEPYFDQRLVQEKNTADFFKSFLSNNSYLTYTLNNQSLIASDPILANIFEFEQLSSISTFRFSFQACRNPGVPSVNPNLGMLGDGLPAVADWIKSNHKELWNLLLSSMQVILPDLEDIIIDYTHTKRLGLFFKTLNTDRPWSTEELSDGTIQTFAMFIAIMDPRNFILAIEEIENSIHPWIITMVFRRLRELSKAKTVIITTHSPIVIDKISPDEAWIVSKDNGETSISNLTKLYPDITKEWEQGKYTLSAFLDSGLVPQAIPGGVQ